MIKKYFFLVALGWACFTGAVGQDPITLLKDINQNASTGGASPAYIVTIGSTIYFSANDGVHGYELWKSNGTAAGTSMVKDINVGDPSSSPYSLTVVGSIVFFVADDGENGSELWRSDGTAAGTYMVMDINPGVNHSYPGDLSNVGGTLFFSADDGVAGYELWKCVGSTASLVKDINSTGSNSSYPSDITNVGGVAYFLADNGTTGKELWKSDGTTLNTVLVKDVNPTSGVSSNPAWLCAMGSNLYFYANDGTNGYELWKSNGTPAGTTMLKDINTTAAGASGSPGYIVTNGTTLFFRANDGVNGYELWKSDGTTGGTVIVRDIHTTAATGSNLAYLTMVGSLVYFSANDGVNGQELWKSDGTFAGTVMVEDINPAGGHSSPTNLYNASGTLYFVASDGTNGSELWKSSGTAATTSLVSDLYPGSTGSSPSYMTNISTTVYFRGNDGSGQELWKTTGTPATTSLVKDIWSGNASSSPNNFTYVGTTMFFTADDGTNGIELWKSDGTTGGTVMVKNINTSGSSSPSNLYAFGSTLYFSANDGNGSELWKSDGTSGGTVMVKDINTTSATASSSPVFFTAMGSYLYFRANDGTNGAELWRTDGTTIGTTLVRDINTAVGGSSSPFNLRVIGSTLFFTAGDATSGYELWKSNGTFAGTVLVKDIWSGTNSSFPQNLTVVGTTLFFIADDGANGYELWKSDGTLGGTVLVKDIYTGTTTSYPSYLTAVGSTLYFQAEDATNGVELWKSDGTLAGTTLVKNIRPAAAGSSPSNLTNVAGTLYFSAHEGTNGTELWKSDGTSGGTVLVKDINSVGGSNPSYLTAYGSLLYLIANDGTGNNVWVTDGRTCATIMVTPFSGAETASPYYLTLGGTKLYFSMVAQGYEREPFILNPALVTLPVATVINTSPSSITRYLSTAASFTVSATVSTPDTPPTYQWKKGGVDIGGAPDNATYNIASVTSGDAGNYTVAVNGKCGTLLSGAATLTVYAADPSVPSGINFSSLTSTGYNVSWTAAAGPPTGYLVIRRQPGSPTGVPADGTVYTAGNTLGDGIIAYIGAATNFNETSLATGTIYYYDVYSYNGSASISALINYATSPLEGNRSTLVADPANQATALSFTSIIQQGHTVSWTAAAGSPSGYLVVRKTGSSPTGVPADGTTYAVSTALGDGTVVHSGSGLTFGESGLANGTTYYYDVFAYNGSGATINYLTASPLEGSQITRPGAPTLNNAAQVLSTSFQASWTNPGGASSYILEVSKNNFVSIDKTIPSTNLEEPVTGLTANTTYKFRLRAVNAAGESPNSTEKSFTTLASTFVQANISPIMSSSTGVTAGVNNGELPYTSVKLFYRGLTIEPQTFDFVNMTNSSGISYTATFPLNETTEPIGFEFYIEVDDDGVITRDDNGGAYHAVYRSHPGQSITFQKFGGKTSDYQIFSIPFKLDNKDISAIFEDDLGGYKKSEWRLFHYQSGTNREYHDGLNTIERGQGYWFNSKTQKTITTGPGIYDGKTFTLKLVAGWNQIGNPWPFDVDWGDVLTFNSNPSGVGDLNLWVGTGYEESESLKTQSGGFVHASAATDILIPAIIKGGLGGRRQTDNPWTIKERALDREQWLVPLALRQGESLNNLGGFGMHPQASESNDGYDRMTVPRFIDYLEANFYHPEYFTKRFSKDVVPTQQSYTWEMTVESNNGSDIAQLEWDHIALGQNPMSLYLYDAEQGLKINMKEVGMYKFQVKEKHMLQFFFSREGADLIPERMVIGKAYPNPFNSSVTIPFTLSNDLPEYKTKISIVDMLGKEVGVIANESFTPGFHEVSWDGNDQNGHETKQGIYLVRFNIQGCTADRFARVVLQR